MRSFGADLQWSFDGVESRSCRYPVFYLQAFHPAKLAFVIGNQNPAFGAGVCCYPYPAPDFFSPPSLIHQEFGIEVDDALEMAEQTEV
ncbi:hypothetical protein [Acidithiobacillus albertensis]|uniref:hypothetical protein n=1 Tax=Acidithiobacillus albertensis TaxID=119978 RepID=UPI0013017601|nr:hypothetical protein [Acidithiobacillus albertensis]